MFKIASAKAQRHSREARVAGAERAASRAGADEVKEVTGKRCGFRTSSLATVTSLTLGHIFT